MIHHLARAFFVRETTQQILASTAQNGVSRVQSAHEAPPARPGSAPVRPRPITPWTAPTLPAAAERSCLPAAGTGRSMATPAIRRVRISTDPSDARRTVISGRFAEVCAALDRLVHEQEALV